MGRWDLWECLRYTFTVILHDLHLTLEFGPVDMEPSRISAWAATHCRALRVCVRCETSKAPLLAARENYTLKMEIRLRKGHTQRTRAAQMAAGRQLSQQVST